MDSFELNKMAGAVLFALLVLFGARTISDIIFAPHKPEKPGYEVAVPDHADTDAGKGDDGKDAVPLAVLLAGGSAEKGQSAAKKCAACHTFDSGGANKIGPNLHGIVGRALASVDGFSFSDALKNKGGSWGYAELDAFLANPKAAVPGTKMAFAGVKKAQERADVILYLRSLGGSPPPLPEPPAAPAAPATPAPAAAETAPAKTDAAPAKPETPPAAPDAAPAAESAPAAPETTPAKPAPAQ